MRRPQPKPEASQPVLLVGAWPLPWWLDAACGAALLLLGAAALAFEMALREMVLGAALVAGLGSVGLGWLLLAAWRAPALGRSWLAVLALVVAAVVAEASPQVGSTASTALVAVAALLGLVCAAASIKLREMRP